MLRRSLPCSGDASKYRAHRDNLSSNRHIVGRMDVNKVWHKRCSFQNQRDEADSKTGRISGYRTPFADQLQIRRNRFFKTGDPGQILSPHLYVGHDCADQLFC